MAPANKKVPTSIRSAKTEYSVPLSFLTPSTTMVSVPAPCMLAPIAVRNRCNSTNSGSLAAFSIVVRPSAITAAISMFSVAPTEGKSR